MNLTETVSEMLSRKVTDEEAKDFALNQFGSLMSYVRKKDVDQRGIHRVNIAEFATELAHAKLIDDFNGESSCEGIYIADEDGTRYADEAQETFDGYYDHFYSMIQDLTI